MSQNYKQLFREYEKLVTSCQKLKNTIIIIDIANKTTIRDHNAMYLSCYQHRAFLLKTIKSRIKNIEQNEHKVPDEKLIKKYKDLQYDISQVNYILSEIYDKLRSLTDQHIDMDWYELCDNVEICLILQYLRRQGLEISLHKLQGQLDVVDFAAEFMLAEYKPKSGSAYHREIQYKKHVIKTMLDKELKRIFTSEICQIHNALRQNTIHSSNLKLVLNGQNYVTVCQQYLASHGL